MTPRLHAAWSAALVAAFVAALVTPGAVIVGGGTFGVLARWNGSNWIVIGG